MKQTIQLPEGRQFSFRETDHSATGRQTILLLGGRPFSRQKAALAATSQKFNFDDFFMAFSMHFHYNKNDG